MARKFIEDIRPGDSLEEAFLVRSKQLRTQRNGAFYLDMELMDRTGVVPAKFWDATLTLNDSFAENDFVTARCRSEIYRKKLQLVVSSVTKLDPSTVDLAEFLPSTRKDVKKLLKRLGKLGADIENKPLKQLVQAFLGDEEFAERLCRAPAGVSMHHACLGGLLEHTVGVAELASEVAERYPMVNRDLLLAGAILHDVGKIEELDCSGAFTYTDRGGLVGHIAIGAMMVAARAQAIEDFPDTLRDQMLHLVLSHHGQHDFGAPVLPATAEAIALHHIDNLDAKLFAFEAAMLGDVDPQSTWTEWNRVFDRKLFKGRI